MMEQQPVKFLNDEDLLNLEKYEYHGGDYTYLDNILNPFWKKVAYAFPTWFAPNLITLTGLLINVMAALLVVTYDPYLVGEAPGWVYINAAICLQIYSVLDAADGKQARRLDASSPLGQIFDHGCDAINLIFIIINCCSGAGFGVGTLSASIIAILCSVFVCAQLIEYQSNVLLAGNKFFGVTEAMLFVSVQLLITGFEGIQFWNIDIVTYLPMLKPYIPSLPITVLFAIGLVVVVSSICVFYLIVYFFRESPIPMDKRGNKNLDRLSYLSRLIPVSVIAGCTYVMLTSHTMSKHPVFLLLFCGLTFSFLSIRVNLAHLCRRRFGYRFSPMYPLIIVTLNHFYPVVRESVLIPVCFCFFLLYYTAFIIFTIQQIKEHLHIRALHIVKRYE